MEKKKFKITWLEILVLLSILAILASVLMQLRLFYMRGKIRQGKCISNLRQLSMLTTMYAQDNKNLMPGLFDPKSKKYNGWVNKLIPYTQSSDSKEVYYNMFYCLESKSEFGTSINYGYNAALIQSDGTGIDEKMILKPDHAGALCDAEPIPVKGGIIGTITGKSDKFSVITVKPVSRHSGGIIIGYVDGHSAFVSENYDENNPNIEVNKAFYRAVELGYIKKAVTKGR